MTDHGVTPSLELVHIFSPLTWISLKLRTATVSIGLLYETTTDSEFSRHFFSWHRLSFHPIGRFFCPRIQRRKVTKQTECRFTFQHLPVVVPIKPYRDGELTPCNGTIWHRRVQVWLCDRGIYLNWLVVSTHLKNISHIGSFPQVGVKIKNIWNHHLGIPWILWLAKNAPKNTTAAMITRPHHFALIDVGSFFCWAKPKQIPEKRWATKKTLLLSIILVG